MSLHQHTLFYDDKASLIAELERLLEKLLSEADQEPYDQVRARYPHLKPSAFSMRLKRFQAAGGRFPHRMKAGGYRIDSMFVTRPLHLYLEHH